MYQNTLYDLMHRRPYMDADTGAAGADTGGTDSGTGAEGAGRELTFDDALKTPGYQAEFDRRVTKALQTAQEKWQKDADARLDAAKTEAEKLAKMTAEQKAEHERKARERALIDRETALAKRELRAQANSIVFSGSCPLRPVCFSFRAVIFLLPLRGTRPNAKRIRQGMGIKAWASVQAGKRL